MLGDSRSAASRDATDRRFSSATRSRPRSARCHTALLIRAASCRERTSKLRSALKGHAALSTGRLYVRDDPLRAVWPKGMPTQTTASGLYLPIMSTTTSRCSERSRARSAGVGRWAKSETGGRATRTVSTAARMPRSPSERTIHPTWRAGRSSSEVSRRRTPPSSTSGGMGSVLRRGSSRRLPGTRPAGAGDAARWAAPAPGLGWLTRAERGQRARFGPVVADVLRLAGVGDLERLTDEEGGAQRARVDVVDVRAGPARDRIR